MTKMKDTFCKVILPIYFYRNNFIQTLKASYTTLIYLNLVCLLLLGCFKAVFEY